MSLNRELLQIVEIDVDFCTRTYGTAPCVAALGTTGVRKCFNTYFTCQDTANFDKGVKTLRFAQNQSGLPKNVLVYPALRGPVSTNAARINLGGVSGRTSTLGKRARVTVNLQDFADSDLGFDPYQAGRKDGTAQTDEGGYDPATRGTFFGKLRRRWPYYVGRALRVKEGYVGDDLADMVTRNYVISEWEGPDINGRVTIIAKDVLDLADNKKALAPAPSTGKIGDDISASYLSTVTLTPASVGDEYAASGKASIGSEIVSFTRSGDVVTLTGRGLDGTDAASHSTDDLFQQCYVAEEQTIPEVVADLLENYAGIDASFLDTANWDSEAERWLAGFNMNAVIAKPEGVASLISEISQHGVVFWWDDTAQLVKMRANRPSDWDETTYSITDAGNIKEGSLESADLHDERLTKVLFWHGQISATGSAEDGSNYRRVFVAVDSDAEGPNEYDQEAVFEVYSRWLGNGNNSVAAAVAARLVNRYRDTPRQVVFDVDVKDRDSLDVASLFELTTRALQDDTGASSPETMQVTSIEERTAGHVLRVTAQTFEYEGQYGFITEDGRGDYGAATDAEKAKGTYAVGASGEFSDGAGPYLIF